MTARTILRLELAQGGSVEIIAPDDRPMVTIFVDADRQYVAVDLTPAEAHQLAAALSPKLLAEAGR